MRSQLNKPTAHLVTMASSEPPHGKGVSEQEPLPPNVVNALNAARQQRAERQKQGQNILEGLWQQMTKAATSKKGAAPDLEQPGYY